MPMAWNHPHPQTWEHRGRVASVQVSDGDDLHHRILNELSPAYASIYVQLVLPCGLHQTYTPAQQTWLMDVVAFTDLVRSRQDS